MITQWACFVSVYDSSATECQRIALYNRSQCNFCICTSAFHKCKVDISTCGEFSF